MSMTAETEREILAHYNLSFLYPTEWPPEKNEGEDNEQETPEAKAAKARHTRRFTTLEHSRGHSKHSGRSPHKGRGRDDELPPLPKDEPDPIGTSASIVTMMRKRGLPPEKEKVFLTSSLEFNPGEFVTQLHPNISRDETLMGWNKLTSTIDQKNHALKKLVESNFERYVRLKATIDNVYTEMRNHGVDERPGSRHTSWQNSSLRTRQLGPAFKTQPQNEKRKNALVAETAYGTAGVEAPLQEASAKANEIWGPAQRGRDREDHLKSALQSVEKNRAILDTGITLEDCIKRRDYDLLTEEYSKAQRFKREAQNIVARIAEADGGPSQVSEEEVQKMIITGRVLMEVDKRIEDFKRDTWRRLTTAHFTSGAETPDGKQEEYMELISVLMQLGVDENPIWVWLQSRYEYLRKRVVNSFGHVRVDLELQRRKLLNTNRPNDTLVAKHLKAAETVRRQNNEDMDTAPVITFWERETSSLSTLLSAKQGLLAEVVEFWNTARSFIEGQKQRGLPVGLDGRSKKFHRLERDNVSALKKYALELFGVIREQLNGMFVERPIEDLSAIISSDATSPKTPLSAVMSPLKASRLTFSSDKLPPLPSQGSPNRLWDSFAFWPPHSNALSASTYLSRLNNIVGIAAAELVSIPLIKTETPAMIVQLRSLVSDVRERSVVAITEAWVVDCVHSKELEDWTRPANKHDVTTLPSRFSAFEVAVLGNLQKIIYVPEAAHHSNSTDVILPPSAKHIEQVQKGFRNSVYKAFASMIEHVSKPTDSVGKNGTVRDDNDITVPLQREQSLSSTGDPIEVASTVSRFPFYNPPRDVKIDFLYPPISYISSKSEDIEAQRKTTIFRSGFSVKYKNLYKNPARPQYFNVDNPVQNARKLLTISNFQYLRADILPSLVTTFESHFLLTISDDAKIMRDVLSQMYGNVFGAYVAPHKDALRILITRGVSAPDYAPVRPRDAKPYVYDTLLHLVMVHTEVTRTAPALTHQVLAFLLEQLSTALIEAFRQRKRYNLPALMQATLDVEFLAQTLDNYTSQRAGDIQGEIYQVLDERTDNEARKKLQKGLPEMKATLKRLRDRTKGEFGCFRRERKHRGRGEEGR